MAKHVEAIINAVGNRPGVICIGDDVAFKGHPMIAPERWDQDIGPYYKTVCDMMIDAGIVPLMHTDGDITDIIPAFQHAGIRGVQGWEGGADPQYINDNFPDFYVIGFGDVGQVLPFGTPEQIDAHVKGLMDALKENPAEKRVALDDGHRTALPAQRQRRGEPRASAPDHDCVHGAADHGAPPPSPPCSPPPIRPTTSSLPGPCLVMRSSGTPVSRATSCMIRKVQKPPWHLPMPARV